MEVIMKIFVTIGSQKLQFNRLLQWMDDFLIFSETSHTVHAQIGYSDYIPQNYTFDKFLPRNNYIKLMNECDVIVTHGGTGAIISGLKNQKKVIAVPRLRVFGEHVDDHQTEITKILTDKNMIFSAKEKEDFFIKLNEIMNHRFTKFESNNDAYINFIIDNIK